MTGVATTLARVILVLRILLAPLLVAVATLAARRYGDRIGGWLSAFPFVAGPLLLVLALERGADFAAAASRNAILGIASLAFFVLAYVHLARRLPWWGALFPAWGVYLLASWFLMDLTSSLGLRLGLAFLGLAIAWLLLPEDQTGTTGQGLPPGLDLMARMVAAGALVTLLSWTAGFLGAGWTGILTPFPVATTVLVTFAHAQGGAAAVSRLLKGYLPALGALAVFFAVIAETLIAQGILRAFGLGLLAVGLWQSALLPSLLKARRD